MGYLGIQSPISCSGPGVKIPALSLMVPCSYSGQCRQSVRAVSQLGLGVVFGDVNPVPWLVLRTTQKLADSAWKSAWQEFRADIRPAFPEEAHVAEINSPCRQEPLLESPGPAGQVGFRR